MQKKAAVTCPQCEAEVEVKDIAPDMQMTYLKGRRVDYEKELKITKELGEGAFAKVYAGTGVFSHLS